MVYANIINVKTKDDIIKNYKSMEQGKPVFVVVTTMPELVEIKLREDIRSLGLFRSDQEYDIITGSSISVKCQLINKGYIGSARKTKNNKYTLTIRSTCYVCDRFLSSSVEKITKEKFTELRSRNPSTDTNVTILDDTSQKCITC